MTERDAGGDFESGSAVDLKRVGLYKYAEHPSTRVWMLSWHVGAERGRWHPGQPFPAVLARHVADGGRFVGHNVAFERVIWNTVLRQRYAPDLPRLEIAQCDCTMARALAIHLPADLDTLSRVLGLPVVKDKEGAALMRRMMKPRKIVPAADQWDEPTYTWWDSPENVERLGSYCDTDDEVERLADQKLLPLSPAERASWELDQRINDRGVAVDAATVQRVIDVLEIAQRRADARMSELTDGVVTRCTQAARLVAWLQSRGIKCDSVGKDEHNVIRVAATELWDDEAELAIQLRAEAAKNSTAKFRRMLDYMCDDGRLRGMLNWHRASTGRWGGAGPQPHNLPRVDPDRELPQVLEAIELMEMLS